MNISINDHEVPVYEATVFTDPFHIAARKGKVIFLEDIETNILEPEEPEKFKVDANLFVETEVHTDCTVQILKDIVTGEESVGWWEN